MSNPADNPKDDNRPKGRRLSTMFMYIREALFFFALMFTSYATFFKSLPRVGKSPPSVPFFPSSSVVADYYRGGMGEAFQEAVRADLAVVMYYAPWDAESQAARPVFDSVARLFHDEIFFAAISCWSPSSECKQHYSKIRSFPVLVAYPPYGVGVQYRGPLVEGYMIRFLQALLRPIHRIHSQEDILHLLTSYTGVVVGSFLFEGNLGGSGYHTFYTSALKTLERDFNHDIAFAITTNSEDAVALNIQELPAIRLHFWNETHEFPLDAEYTVESVSNWAWQKTHHLAKWVSLPGVKATTLSKFISSRPTLMVFTPGHPMLSNQPVPSLVKGLSLRYNICPPWGTPLVDKMDELTRSIHRNIQRLELKCLRLKQVEMAKKMATKTVTSTVIAASALNNRSGCNACHVSTTVLGPQLEVCVRPMGSVAANKSTPIRYDTSMWDNENDRRGPNSLLKKTERKQCKLLERTHSHSKIYYPKMSENAGKTVGGLSCVNNRTLNFVVLDSLLHYQIAEGLGVDVMNRSDKTLAVIVDPKAESQFILKEPLTETSLAGLIVNYTNGKSERHLRVSDVDRNVYGKHRYLVRPVGLCQHTDTESCVIELNSENFLSHVMDPNKAVILMYHSPYCALCRSVAHIFLLVARHFRHFPVVQFARIDGENNDLPWQYTMDTYPSILIFPVAKKEESRVYSDQLPFTVRNLMHFVLANFEPEAKVSAMFYLCASFEKQQTDEEAKNCKTKVIAQAQEGLAKALHQMRLLLARLKSVDPKSKTASALYQQQSLLMLSLQYFRSVLLTMSSVGRAKSSSREVLDIYLRFRRSVDSR